MCLMLKGLLLLSQTTPKGKVTIPPSPVAQSFEIFGRYPVSTYTGLADISIPILQQKVDGFDLNIALRYHPSGIKVNQIASWVGLGWNISGIGTITRSINGCADEDPEGILNRKRYYPPSLTNMNYCESEFIKPNTNPENYLYLRDVAEGIKDSESDSYFLNVGGISCQFIIRPDGKCETLPLSNIIIEYIGGYTWKVKDEQGNVYFFEEYETTSSVKRNDGIIDEQSNKTAWYLTKVVTGRGQEIVYKYQTAGCTSSPARNESFCYYYKDLVNLFDPKDVISTNTDEVLYNTPVLSSISFPGGKIVFEVEKDKPRLDQRTPAYPLKKIRVYSDKEEILSEYETSYTYFESDGGLDLVCNKRLKLTDLSIKSKEGTIKKFNFDYYEDIKLPPANSCAQDYWGFYNGELSNDVLNLQFRLIPNEVFREKSFTNHNGVRRTSKFPEMRAWTLKGITYPTGGRSVFEYMPHDRFLLKGSSEDKEVSQTV